MLKTDRQPIVGKTNSIRGLYKSYSAMLLGYILEVVKDRKLAEECMVQLFCDISQHFNAMDWESGSNWCRLQRLAQRKLSTFTDTFSQCDEETAHNVIMPFAQNNYLNLLNDQQRQVFCAIYYHRKPVSEVSKELNITEDLTRKTLKEAFAIMRDGGKN